MLICVANNMPSYSPGTPYDIIYGTEAKLIGILNQDNVEIGGLLVKNQASF